MKGFCEDIESLALENTSFRQVLYTAHHSQIVLMSLHPGEEIGMEVHPENDQYLRFESGTGMVVIDGNKYDILEGFVVIVPAGAEHNVVNTSDEEDLKLYTIYAPPHHQDGLVQETKAEAAGESPEFMGETTE